MRFVHLALLFACLFVFGLLAALYVVLGPDSSLAPAPAAGDASGRVGAPVGFAGAATGMPDTGSESRPWKAGVAELEGQTEVNSTSALEAAQPPPELLIATATPLPATPAPEQDEPGPEYTSEHGAALPFLPDLPVRQPLATQGALPGVEDFVRSVADGNPEALRGVYAPGVMALQVVQQPGDDAAFVSPEDDTATQFRNAEPFGVFGLLAHNYLAGRYFHSFTPGNEMFLVFGDGGTRRYRVTEIAQYERLTLGDVRSDFLDVATGQVLDAAEVFARYYDGPHHLTLQTCIEKDGLWNWGVQFTLAEPAD